MITIKTQVVFEGQSVLLVTDLDFNNETGVFCNEWQVFRVTPACFLQPRNKLIPFDIQLLPADDLIQLADELRIVIESNRSSFGTFAAVYRAINQ